MYNLLSVNKGANQLWGYHAVDLHLCFPIRKNQVSHDAAHMKCLYLSNQVNRVAVLICDQLSSYDFPAINYSIICLKPDVL